MKVYIVCTYYTPTKIISIYEVKNMVSKMICPFYEYMQVIFKNNN